MRLEDRFDYSAAPSRARVQWPNGARIAVWVAPNVEHYEFLPTDVRVRDPYPRTPHPDILNYGLRDYGNRVGLWRLFDVLDRHEIRCSVSLSMSVLKMYPQILDAMEARGWDYMSHGLYNTRYHWSWGKDEERAAIEQCCRIHEEMTGRPLPGWFSPATSFTPNTLDLVAEAGIPYVGDLYHDDQPTWVRTRSGAPLVAMPYTMMLNDFIVHRENGEGESFAQAMIDTFDTLYAEADQPAGGRVMCIALHPFWVGVPSRIRHFQRAMDYIAGHKDVWFATAPEIMDVWKARQPEAAR